MTVGSGPQAASGSFLPLAGVRRDEGSGRRGGHRLAWAAAVAASVALHAGTLALLLLLDLRSWQSEPPASIVVSISRPPVVARDLMPATEGPQPLVSSDAAAELARSEPPAALAPDAPAESLAADAARPADLRAKAPPEAVPSAPPAAALRDRAAEAERLQATAAAPEPLSQSEPSGPDSPIARAPTALAEAARPGPELAAASAAAPLPAVEPTPLASSRAVAASAPRPAPSPVPAAQHSVGEVAAAKPTDLQQPVESAGTLAAQMAAHGRTGDLSPAAPTATLPTARDLPETLARSDAAAAVTPGGEPPPLLSRSTAAVATPLADAPPPEAAAAGPPGDLAAAAQVASALAPGEEPAPIAPALPTAIAAAPASAPSPDIAPSPDSPVLPTQSAALAAVPAVAAPAAASGPPDGRRPGSAAQPIVSSARRPEQEVRPDAMADGPALLNLAASGPAIAGTMGAAALNVLKERARTRLAQILGELECAHLSAEFGDGAESVRLAGHISSDAELQKLREQLLAAGLVEAVLADDVALVPMPHCATVGALASAGIPPSSDHLEQPADPGRGAHGGTLRFREGQLVSFSLKTPDFRSVIYVDYYDSSGSVLHLVPNAAFGDGPMRPGVTLEIGGSEGPELRVAAPFGLDLVVAIGATHPLFQQHRPLVEDAGQYRQALAAAVLQNRETVPGFRAEYMYLLVETAP